MRQNGTIATGYTPKHAKPASRKDAALGDLAKSALGDRAKSAVNAPSIGRHAAVSAASSAAAAESSAENTPRDPDTDSRRAREAKTPTAA